MTQYEIILEYLLGEFEREASCLVNPASDTAIKFKVVASEFARLFELLDFVRRQIFPDTAEGEYLDRHGAVRGIIRKAATPASGRVVFHAKEAAAEKILIPAGTLVASSQNNLIFRTTDDAAIEKGASYALAMVEATENGPQTNLAPRLLDLVVTPIAGISSVENTEKLSGGADEESEECYRRRVLESYNQISNGANLHYYEQFAKSKSGVWFARADFVEGSPNQIRLFVENATRTISDALIAELQEEMEAARELNVQLTVQRPTPKPIDVSLTLYCDNTANSSSLILAAGQALTDSIQALSVGERFSQVSIGRDLLALSGVLDVVFTSPTSPVTVAGNEIAVPGSLHITTAKA